MPRVHPQQEWSVERHGLKWVGCQWDGSGACQTVTRRYWRKSSAQEALSRAVDWADKIRQALRAAPNHPFGHKEEMK